MCVRVRERERQFVRTNNCPVNRFIYLSQSEKKKSKNVREKREERTFLFFFSSSKINLNRPSSKKNHPSLVRLSFASSSHSFIAR